MVSIDKINRNFALIWVKPHIKMDKNYQTVSKIDISVKNLLKTSQRLTKTDKNLLKTSQRLTKTDTSCFYLNSIDLSHLGSNKVASKSFKYMRK